MGVTAAVLGVLPALAGCGGHGGPSAPGPPVTGEAAATQRDGDAVVLRGDASPRTHGPLTLDGTYVLRFRQRDPQDPAVDFAQQTAFELALVRDAGTPRQRERVVFREAAGAGSRTVRVARGRYAVEVRFGDFPYEVRLAPRR